MTRKNTLLAVAFAAATLALGGNAVAQDRGNPHARDSRQDTRHDDQEHGNGHAYGHDKDRRADEPREAQRDDRRDQRSDDRHDDRREARRGAGPEHSYYRGGRLPTYYRSNQYVVDDWRGHHLSSPPRGYHWVQTGSDYVLVAVATGIIASILLSN